MTEPTGWDPADELDPPEDDESSALEDEAVVTCPYCGEESVIGIDQGGGIAQEYVEDCPVCCRPWQVHVAYDEGGGVVVWLTETG